MDIAKIKSIIEQRKPKESSIKVVPSKPRIKCLNDGDDTEDSDVEDEKQELRKRNKQTSPAEQISKSVAGPQPLPTQETVEKSGGIEVGKAKVNKGFIDNLLQRLFGSDEDGELDYNLIMAYAIIAAFASILLAFIVHSFYKDQLTL